MAHMRGRTSNGALFALLYANAFLGSYSNNIVNVALPDIMAEFAVDATTAQWLVSGFMIVTVITVLSMASIYRRFGTRTLFLAVQFIFIGANTLGLVSPSFAVTMLARLLQGAGTGISMPLMMTTVILLAPSAKKGFLLGIGSCIITLGSAFAPVVSGALVTGLGWRAIFLLPLVLSAVLLVLGLVFVRNVNETHPGLPDALSALLLAVGMFFVSYGLTRVVASPLEGVASLLIGAGVVALFAWRQKRVARPLLNLAPFRNPRFLPSCALVLVVLMATFSMSILLPLYYEQACGMTALVAGSLMIVPVICNTVTGVAAGALFDRFGGWPLIVVGFICIVLGQAVMASSAQEFSVPLIIAAASVAYGGVGIASSPSQVQGLSALERRDYPHGVSILAGVVQLAGTLAPSLYVSILDQVQATQSAAGASVAMAGAAGLSSALVVAAVVSFAGLAIAIPYTFKLRKRSSSK